ncbi:Regulator of G- signaling 3 [Brachionus plicatilis]|uniref:Regulator of G-signaling 3 n=1 Tax=Brachionus plicatilis TaxID=10195 RepID=A0A3M7QAK0_BRAPC|nr:Regulator of G- signaling 3 [Brachionus plicatilis]
MSAFRSTYTNGHLAQIRPVDQLTKPVYQTSLSSNSTHSSNSSTSVQIRTSSPISSSASDSSGPVNISPNKFLNAVHTSRKCQAEQEPKAHGYMKQLAFDKLRRQHAIEQDLKENLKHLRLCHQSDTIKSMGKIKLSIYNNFNHLTCHIMEARSLKCDPLMGTYCKISVLPDLNKSFRNIRTKSIGLTYNKSGKMSYQYDSKFSFELCELNDFNQRIVLWVCSHSNQLIGCLTFKLKHVINQDKPRHVWYHLLPFKFGLSKHVKCSVKKMKAKAGPTNVNKDLQGMQKILLNICKTNESDSYGFTVTHGCPCMVGKVDLDRVAFSTGLRPGDYISRVNGVNVSRASCESVVKLIKSSRAVLQMEVHRQMVVVAASRLESVPEEEEEECDDELELDEEDEVRVGAQEEDDMNYFKIIQNSLRYVDSVSSNECSNMADFDEENGAHKMRQVAAKFYSNSEVRHANLRQLQMSKQSTTNVNQFI